MGLSSRKILTVLVLGVAVAALYVAAAPGSALQGANVDAGDNFFDPKKTKIGAGEKVTWTNVGDTDHTVKLKGKPNKVIGPGESTSIKFKKTGKFPYRCTLHSGMEGKVVAGDQ